MINRLAQMAAIVAALATAQIEVSAQESHDNTATEIQYRNPIIAGYHPDPSICMVGDTYYLVNSTFQYFPGVPISASKDLINWSQIGNVLTRNSQLPLEGATSWTGIYAPTLRYHEGIYYMITTNVGHGGNFFVTATDPRGPWSEPIWLKQLGIDPSFFFEDGKCYFCSNPGDAIWLCEIDPTTGEQLTESKIIWTGTGGRYPEGPHIYKKDGYYYLLISEGGTEIAHSLTIARSKNIYGPYESNPANPILTNCNKAGQTKQVQGTGHGDLVQSADGNWWIVFLAYRQFGGAYHHLGRETFLAPVRWDEGEWPVVNNGEAVDTLMTAPLQAGTVKTIAKQNTSITTPGIEWVYLQNPLPQNYEFTQQRWTLRPHGTLTENNQPTYIGRRQESTHMTFEATMTVNPARNQQPYGLSIYQINNGHIDFCIEGDEVKVVCHLKSLSATAASAPKMKGKRVTLRITSDETFYHFAYSTDGIQYQELTSLECTLVSTEVAGGFTGVTVGLYADGDINQNSAQFEQVKYSEKSW